MELVPWDGASAEQCDRFYHQRVACGWGWDIDRLKETNARGSHAHFWLVLKDDFPGKEDMVAKHVAKFPQEATPLKDTAGTLWAKPREPPATGRQFVPLGHVALGRLQPGDERATAAGDDAASMAWVGPLYVSWAVQRSGLGRFAMDQAERLATLPPLNARTLALDTVPSDQALQPDLVRTFYEDRGFPTPVISNHDWYLSRGYKQYKRIADLYPWTDTHTGEEKMLGSVLLKKKLQSVGDNASCPGNVPIRQCPQKTDVDRQGQP